MSPVPESRIPGRALLSARAPAFVLLIAMAALLATGCATVEPWQRGQLASEAMASDVSKCHRFEHNNEVYREGAVGANGGKSGGGCGCT